MTTKITLGPTSALPITRANLLRMLAACDPDTLAGTRDRALLAYGWATAAARAQLVAARIDTIPRDQLDHPALVLRDNVTLATELVTDWLLALAIELNHPAVTGPLFRPVNRHDHLADRPHLSGEGVNVIVHRAVRRARLPHPERYSTRSLRTGGRLGI